jgi:hypothetical protein
VRKASSTLRTQPVPPDVFTQLEIMEMSTTLELWGELSAHAVVGLLDRIRTRALTLLLELEAANPDAGESVDGSTPVAAETLDRIVQTVIYTGSIMVAPAAQIAIQQDETARRESGMRYQPRPTDRSVLGSRAGNPRFTAG